MTVLYDVVRTGHAATVTRVGENVTGHKPLTFREFTQANVGARKSKPAVR